MAAEDSYLDTPGIPGGTCRACGLVFAPFQAFGCERCGAHGEDLESTSLAASGTLLCSAAVFMHRKPTPATPFTIVEVALDAGPIIRALSAGGSPPKPGARMTGTVDQGADGLWRFAEAVVA